MGYSELVTKETNCEREGQWQQKLSHSSSHLSTLQGSVFPSLSFNPFHFSFPGLHLIFYFLSKLFRLGADCLVVRVCVIVYILKFNDKGSTWLLGNPRNADDTITWEG
ncbi:unnamed protein product [Lupinus luteus]|uniref:Uncharacterized protein n=1 Tax=Lupinus luteus TaxID=3873 RepID=A0AAV1WN98_LUPLU